MVETDELLIVDQTMIEIDSIALKPPIARVQSVSLAISNSFTSCFHKACSRFRLVSGAIFLFGTTMNDLFEP
jgi:hypothetical protein